MTKAVSLGWLGIVALLIETSSRDLSAIDGAFGVTKAEWTIVCFSSGIVMAAVGAAIVFFTKKDDVCRSIEERDK